MTPTPTGRRRDTVLGDSMVLRRTFVAPREVVWAAVTEPERLSRWIGTWSGDPTTGTVEFRMTAEGGDAPAEVVTIEACEPPALLRARMHVGGNATPWHWQLGLEESGGVTTLTFAQQVAGDIRVVDVGPGWEYYLDRLVAHLDGGDVDALDWTADYHPVMGGYYAALFEA